MRAIILAGGKATRLRPITDNIPKALLPLNNKPVCFYQIDLLKKYGIGEIIFALGYLGERIKEQLGNGRKFGVKIYYATESFPLDTAGAIRNAFDSVKNIDLKTPLIILNGDILTNINISKLLNFHQRKNSLVTICLIKSFEASSYGVVFCFADGRIRGFKEKPKDLKEKVFINAGIYIIQPQAISYIPKGKRYSFERDFIPDLIKKDLPVYGYKGNGYWIDIGTPKRYSQAQKDILKIKL